MLQKTLQIIIKLVCLLYFHIAHSNVIECGRKLCQNSSLVKQPDIEIPINKIIDSYINNPITHAIVLGGLEPLDSFGDVLDLIKELRIGRLCDDDIVIYTGYNKEEVLDKIKLLKEFKKYNYKVW